MSKPKTDLAPRIREKTLELLLEKEPEEISTRDIAKACEVTATSLYYYYRDKEALFIEIKLDCIKAMDRFILEKSGRDIAKHQKANKKSNLLIEIKAGLEAFRDWAFINPRIAILVMGRLEADTQTDPKKMEKYYKSTVFAKTILDKAVKAGISDSKDTLLDANLCIAALWCAIEMVLLKRTVPKYWSRKGSMDFTNKMIDLLLSSFISKNRKPF